MLCLRTSAAGRSDKGLKNADPRKSPSKAEMNAYKRILALIASAVLVAAHLGFILY